LIEKPMGRNLDEAMALGAAQAHRPDRVLKIGFNHRYHPALMEAQALLRNGLLGDFIFARAVYGHGGRPGYEKEWRGNADLAGGGELTDQGVHLLDLIGWFCGAPEWVFAQRRCFAWPTRLQRLERSDCGQVNGLEDNGLFMLGWANGALAQVHTSWTQWKNRFSFHVYGTLGAVEVEGLGGSYGEESLKLMKRNPKGGAPEMETRAFPGEDLSWKREWEDFRQAIGTGGHPMGNAEEGLRVMTILDAVYRSCESHLPVPINPASLNPDVSGVALAKTEHRTPTPCFDA
ncbi:MAG: Gfo/Idh/MocA family oxidoreductase, partial [Lentisphaerae bacterium]|nr:Gfo/Idh/MocA family oxidoreductase [Lentisphaerota bacterium]